MNNYDKEQNRTLSLRIVRVTTHLNLETDDVCLSSHLLYNLMTHCTSRHFMYFAHAYIHFLMVCCMDVRMHVVNIYTYTHIHIHTYK